MEPVVCYTCPQCDREHSPDDLSAKMMAPSGEDVVAYISCDECGYDALVAWELPVWKSMWTRHERWRQEALADRKQRLAALEHEARSDVGRIVAHWRDGELSSVDTVDDVQRLWDSTPDKEGTR